MRACISSAVCMTIKKEIKSNLGKWYAYVWTAVQKVKYVGNNDLNETII